ncbi:MAG TPA: dihydrodipicolinate reductase C-terminal domain-containing protein [Rectinemataceae bacterium]|nr:dihydrodipicolinate reductase C-terminal domain-containing protein [Rectinemataceae bacterium]
MRIGLFGAGRLGQAVMAAADEAGHEIVWALEEAGDPPSVPDVALDASQASGVAAHVAWARRVGCPLVVGATGWEPSILDGAEAWDIGVMVSPNFSLGVAFMRRAALALGRFSALVGGGGTAGAGSAGAGATGPAVATGPVGPAASLSGGADLAILERHHNKKADAPSGTAKLLAEALAEGNRQGGGSFSGWCTGAAQAGKINVASLRAGDEVGYHELRLEAPAETIVFSHDAHSRAVFASGAIRALEWMRGRKGLYSFDDFAATLIDPLFASGGH